MLHRYIKQVIPGPNGTIYWAEGLQQVAEVAQHTYVDGDPPAQPPEVMLEPVTLTPELAETLVNASHPMARTQSLMAAFGPRFVAQLPALPTAPVSAGDYYRHGSDMWMVVQSHDRSIFGGDPAQYPALMRRARNPYVIEAWSQPFDQFDAYKLSHPLTGEPERCLHNGQEQVVTGADGNGNNVWQPGTFGWSIVREAVAPSLEWQPNTAYVVGDIRTYQGPSYRCRQSHTSLVGWHPPAVPALWELV